jgi:UDP-N-acetylmuramoyl-L-alanyl-D-glutamate--2,6-diaminopimelate ligase
MSAAPGVSLMWLFDGIAELPANDARVEDLTLDSREVRPGSLFFALNGHKSHGLRFLDEAAARGASVVLWDPEGAGDAPGADSAAALRTREQSATPVFTAPISGLRQLLGRIADRFFGWPSSHMRIVGITGTNGKTTSAYLLAQCLERLKSNAAYMGTIGWGPVRALENATHTTPDVITLHRQLAKLRAAGVRALAMEVSSHALDQGRVDAVRFEVAAFTNLTRDHLDYHPSMQAYGEAKARLFAFTDLRHLVINVGDGFGRDFAMRYQGRVPLTAVWVGVDASGWFDDRSLKVDEVALDLHGMTLTLGGSFGAARVTTKLVGAFNAENSVVVLASLLALDVTLADAATALAACTAPPGRMELIESSDGRKPSAVIDYAHTPDALAKVLTALRQHCAGDLWCVFGCGGDRDPGKRPLMGAVADELADRIIVTDDNPRSEDPPAITRGIVQGISAHEARVIHDRGAAIATALTEAAAGDMVLIAGKGHEDYQIYGNTRRRFSDRTEALRHLRAVA